MDATGLIGAACAVALAAALAVASVTDLRRRVVPNACALLAWASGVLAARLSARGGGRGGVGGGDVKLLAAVAAWAGPVGGLAVVALSCALGLLGWGAAALLARLRRRRVGRAMPLAPAIALAAALVLSARVVSLP